MSYSSGPARSFGGKGVSQKKAKKKKQEFHRHKVKFTEEEQIDLDQLKARVSVGLDKLGHQRFSVEPGGYTFHNWMTSFNLLLDDFEERAGPGNLPKEYYETRQMLTADLQKPVETKEIDEATSRTETDIELVNNQLASLERARRKDGEEESQVRSRIGHLRMEQSESQIELERAVDELEKGEKRRSFIGRLLSSGPSIEKIKERVSSLRARNKSITEEIRALESKSGKNESDAEIAQLRKRLDDLRETLAGLNTEKMEKTQLYDQRLKVTGELSQIVSSMNIGHQEEKVSAEQT
jgi:hypothetical protein